MQIILDTNILIRFFTNGIPDKALKVKKLLESGKNLQIPDVVFPELEYILSNQHNSSRDEIIQKYKFLTGQNNISTSIIVKKAVQFYSTSKLDMADCIITASSLK